MTRPGPRDVWRPWTIGLTVAYVYEVTALTTRRVPSISATCWSLRYTRRGRAILAAGIIAFAWHLLGTGPGAMPRGWADNRQPGRWLGVPLADEKQ